MAHPAYVLLPDGVEWTAVPGTSAQAPRPVRWYLRQSMPMATTQTGVLVDDTDDQLARRLAAVARRAQELGGVAVDASTQQVIDPDAVHVRT
jgi:hypothetical protein